MSKRILVVEDQEDLRAILRDFLSTSGYTVRGRRRRGVAKAAAERPDLVLMGIQLPVIDHYDAPRQIKELSPPTAPVWLPESGQSRRRCETE